MRDYDANCYDRAPNVDVYEEHLDEGKVERAGYMEVEDIVRDLIESGERLQMYREAMYPDVASVPDDDNGIINLNKIDTVQRVVSVNKVLLYEKRERERKRYEEEQGLKDKKVEEKKEEEKKQVEKKNEEGMK